MTIVFPKYKVYNNNSEFKIKRRIWETHSSDHIEFVMSSGPLIIQSLWVRDFLTCQL